MTNAYGLPGHNVPKDAPDYAAEEIARLKHDYGEVLENTVPDLEAQFQTLPEEIPDPQGKQAVVNLIRRAKDVSTSLSGYHEVEKQPHLRRGQAVDQTFFGAMSRLFKRNKNDRPGIGDILGQRLTRYDARILAEEQEARRKEAEKAAAIALAAQQAKEKAEKEERDRIEAAARARKQENIDAHNAAAAAAAEAASAARVEEAVAVATFEQKHVETLAKPADIMRTRTEQGTLSTMTQEPFAEILDRNTLDLERLRAFIPLAALQTALNGYARSHGYSADASVQIEGARFGKRPKSLVR